MGLGREEPSRQKEQPGKVSEVRENTACWNSERGSGWLRPECVRIGRGHWTETGF